MNDDQTTLWNGASGHAWVEAQELLDQVFAPIAALLVEPIGVGARVLDVGCGTGATTLAAAQRVGDGGGAVGADLSAPMIAHARARAAAAGSAATFVLADAQTHDFDQAGFDAIVSRFGVMFFDDPVAAFANLRRAAADGARLRVVAWRGPDDNPFMTAAERAAAPLLPDLPPRPVDGPGQFGFADPARVRRILDDAGWSEATIAPMDVACAFSAAELDRYFTRLGPLARVLPTLDDATRARLVEVVRLGFDRFVHGDEVRFTAACWLVEARGTRRR